MEFTKPAAWVPMLWPEEWRGAAQVDKPGLLIAGTNCVTTDAVSTALMGFDPMADRGTPPFENRDNTMRLAEDAGLGTRRLEQIEVIGERIRDATFDFSKHDPVGRT